MRACGDFNRLCGGLTSWRSAANAPDEYQGAMIMLGAFVSCNGMLGAIHVISYAEKHSRGEPTHHGQRRT